MKMVSPDFLWSDWIRYEPLGVDLKNNTILEYSILSRGFLRNSCSEIMQQIFRRTPMSKSSFNKVAKQFYWNCSLTWVFSWKFAAYFQNTFSANSNEAKPKRMRLQVVLHESRGGNNPSKKGDNFFSKYFKNHVEFLESLETAL